MVNVAFENHSSTDRGVRKMTMFLHSNDESCVFKIINAAFQMMNFVQVACTYHYRRIDGHWIARVFGHGR